MATCPCCGAIVSEGERVCSQCGTLIEQKSQYSHGPEPVQQPVQQPAQQPIWAQYGAQPQAQPTFYVPKRPLGKGGAITMIVIGAIMLAVYLSFILNVSVDWIRNGVSDTDALIPMIVSFSLTLFAGGLMLLLFGIRKLKNVKRYNASLENPQ